MFDFFTFGYDSFDEFLSEYYRLALIAAIVLYFTHRARPYPIPKMLRKDFEPPEKIIGSFSLGQLLRFVIQTLTFPFLIFMFVRLKQYGSPLSYLFFIALLIWVFLPILIENRIDNV